MRLVYIKNGFSLKNAQYSIRPEITAYHLLNYEHQIQANKINKRKTQKKKILNAQIKFFGKGLLRKKGNRTQINAEEKGSKLELTLT